MPASPDFLEFLLDQLRPLGPLTTRRMFGCDCVCRDWRMFAIVTPEDRVFLKVNPDTKARFEAAGSEPFTYTSSGRVRNMGYFTAPDAALDDPDAMLDWARLAVHAAERAPERPPRKLKALRRRKASNLGPGD